MARTIARDHDDKRRHILKEAAKVFARDGIARTSMSEVARACGISKANIYHYYSGKDELVFGILDAYLSELRERICTPDLERQPPRDRLRSMTETILLAYEGMDAEHQIQTEGLPLLPQDRQDILKGYQRDMVNSLARILQACAPDVFTNDRKLLRQATMSVFGMLNWFYRWNAEAGQADRIAYAHVVADLTLDGLGGLGGKAS